jgi:alpha-tubulin suppressor-like RCC1 family protein
MIRHDEGLVNQGGSGGGGLVSENNRILVNANYTITISPSGKAYFLGRAFYGCAGTGIDDFATPVDMPHVIPMPVSVDGFIAVEGGTARPGSDTESGVFLQDSNKYLWAAGKNDSNDLGVGSTGAIYTYTRVSFIGAFFKVSKFKLGRRGGVIIAEDAPSSAWLTGQNLYTIDFNSLATAFRGSDAPMDAVAIGTTVDGWLPMYIYVEPGGFNVFAFGYYHQMAGVNSAGTNWVPLRAVNILPPSDKLLIASGANQTLIADSSVPGFLKASGSNAQQQCGGPVNQTRQVFTPITMPSSYSGKLIKKVSCGPLTSFVLLEDGMLLSFGDNAAGAAGAGSTVSNRGVPTPVEWRDKSEPVLDIWGGNMGAVCLGASGTLYATGSSNNGRFGSHITGTANQNMVFTESPILTDLYNNG